MTRTATLRRQHDAIVELAGEITAASRSVESLLDAERIMRTLRRLNGVLVAHLASEDTFLYPAMRGSSDAHTAETARAFGEEMGGVVGAYDAFGRRWSDAETIYAGWTQFAGDWRDLLRALANRIERENTILYPLADAMDDGPVQKRA